MKFKTGLMSIFMVFIAAVALVTGAGFYRYTNRQYEIQERQTMEFYGRHITESIRNNIDSMADMTRYLLSSSNVLNSLYMLAAWHTSENIDEVYYREAIETIDASMNTDYINLSFYRIIIFNKYGDILVNRNFGENYVDTQMSVENISWISMADENPGENIVIGQHIDDWGARVQPQVYSVVKKMIGSMECYIEVQFKADDVSEFIRIEDSDKRFIIFNDSGDMIYQSDEENTAQFKQYSNMPRGNYETKESLIMVDRDYHYGLTTVIIEDKSVWLSKTKQIMMMTFLVAAVFMAVSLIYVWLSASYLTKPIRKMRQIIDRTQLSDLSSACETAMPANEIEALNYSYQKLLTRLHETMVREQKMATLNLQAQLDILQSQMNPHFLYNVLNVISSRGILDGDEEICNICGNLASMLRYTTDTSNRTASMKDEIHYVEMYAYLLKSRYEHRIDFDIHIDPEMTDYITPKMVIQQIAENCVEHGFGSREVLKIQISTTTEKKCWSVTVWDNGDGFAPGKIEEIQKKFEVIRQQISDEYQIYESKIGGMGLMNAYARLYLFFGGHFEMRLTNEEGAKVEVIIWRDEDV